MTEPYSHQLYNVDIVGAVDDNDIGVDDANQGRYALVACDQAETVL